MIDAKIQKILDQLPRGALEFQQIVDAIYLTRYTGPLTFDFLNGLPRQINLGQPVKLTICAGTAPGGVDNGNERQKT